MFVFVVVMTTDATHTSPCPHPPYYSLIGLQEGFARNEGHHYDPEVPIGVQKIHKNQMNLNMSALFEAHEVAKTLKDVE